MTENLSEAFELRRKQSILTRNSFALSGLHEAIMLNQAADLNTPNNSDLVRGVTKLIVLPYLLYGPVVVDYKGLIDTDYSSVFQNLKYVKSKGMFVSLEDAVPNYDEVNQTLKGEFYQKFNEKFSRADMLRCAGLAELARRKLPEDLPRRALLHAEAIRKICKVSPSGSFQEAAELVSEALGLEKHRFTELSEPFSQLSNKELIAFCERLTKETAFLSLQSKSLVLRQAGIRAIPNQLEDVNAIIEPPDADVSPKSNRAAEIILKELSFPLIPNERELIDFLSREEYRGAISSFRKFISSVGNEAADDASIYEELRDSMERVEKAARIEKMKTATASLKMVFSDVPGALFEFILKGNLPGFVDKILNVFERVAKIKDDRSKVENDPLYILWKIHRLT